MKYPSIANMLILISGFLLAQSVITLTSVLPSNEQLLIDAAIYLSACLIIYLIFNKKSNKHK